MGTTRSKPTHTALQLISSARTLPLSATLAMNEAVAKRRASGKETLHLGFGEAAFPLHPLLKTALAEAATRTSYAPVLGIPALRQAIADYLTRTRGIICSAEQVVVGPGSKPLLYALLHILEGDVLLPVPSWVSYAPMAHLAGKSVINVSTDVNDHHRLTPQGLSHALKQARDNGADPRIILVNSPSNPTGSMFAPADVEALAVWAREVGITLISDEIYAELAHGWREHVSPVRFYPEGCIITSGLSKAFSAGGWRLGYAVLPATLAGEEAMMALRALASEIWSTSATPLQEAALVAYTPNATIEQYVQRSALLHAYVADQLYHALIQLGILCSRPAGGFYLYPDFSPWRASLLQRGVSTSDELARYLLDEWGIATLPGTVFNEDPSALRLRLATSLLYEPEHAASQEERDVALWQLLAQAEEASPPKANSASSLSLPVLEHAQTRWAEVIHELSQSRLSS
jgi:aspartate aminotransferase